MPATSAKQQRFFAMCATHGGRHAQKNCPDMPVSKMKEFMHKPIGGYPGKKSGG